ncbi:precorrin-6A reductase [Mangrovibacterium marinum]|uniref:Cobalt-precorrin 6A reductase n=1 Tax=Mangrovibacterium marinum TaxID=1639118 RepID=A0A2T5C3D9_9BACT|nr:precorrin-6A reductase [Mangrovibacterium marinum]PTN09263.1 cobalt-precorrin 6A reductase [Mangrovibacterium marinum]
MIWIIGGTSDANRLAERIRSEGHRVLISTTTAYGSQLAALQNFEIMEQQLSESDMEQLLTDTAISVVVDASHPFAELVSTQAMAVCARMKRPYLRFEREQVQIAGAHYYPDYDELIETLKQTSGNILLTIGSKNVHRFCPELLDRIVARVLPVSKSLDECQAAGLLAHQLIAMKGRMRVETNRALMEEYLITQLVCKESGEAGGLLEKCQAAQELGIAAHIISRPRLHYPLVFSDPEALVQQLNETLKVLRT